MPSTPVVVEQWLSLPREALLDKVRQAVKRRDAEARQIWAAVRVHSVLVAQVRGALSALKAEVRGTRDEGMWGMWIEQARQALDQIDAQPAPAQVTAAARSVRSKIVPVAAEAAEPEQSDPEIDQPLAFTPQPEKPRPASTVPPVMFQSPGN